MKDTPANMWHQILLGHLRGYTFMEHFHGKLNFKKNDQTDNTTQKGGEEEEEV